MDKLEKIKQLLKEWEADFEDSVYGAKSHYNGGVKALESALGILNEPPNKEVANVCAVCGAYAEIKVVGKEIYYCDGCIS